jgi:hypothetical protein
MKHIIIKSCKGCPYSFTQEYETLDCFILPHDVSSYNKSIHPDCPLEDFPECPDCKTRNEISELIRDIGRESK